MNETERKMSDELDVDWATVTWPQLIEAIRKQEARCCCGAPANGRMIDGEPRCCATCAFHPLGCRCKYGDAPDTAN